MQHRSPNPSAVRRRTPWSIPLLAVTVGAGLVALAGCAGSGTTDDPAITPRPAAHSAAPSTSASATPTDSRPSTGAASAGDDSA
ncbi:MAG: hypothetical protein INR72_16695, partial [Williamsia herbipolensis]|nr:hypothetical protein [Williamsia herbipolensis]